MSQHKKFFEVEPEELLRRIKTNFPELTWKNYKYIDEGWDHQVIILDDKLVFRFPDDAEFKALLKSEISVLKRLEPQVHIRIPHYTYVAPDYSFARYPIVTGQQLTKPYFDSLSPADQTNIAQQLAGFLTTMHRLKRANFPSIVVTDMPAWQQEIKELTARHLTSVLHREDFDLVQQTIQTVDEILKIPQPTVPIHGDVYSRHLFWDATGKSIGLIDFSDMNIGDPAFDFAELYEYGDEFVTTMYHAYNGPKNDTFLQRAKTFCKWMGVFMMTDHFLYHKTSFAVARQTFDRTKHMT